MTTTNGTRYEAQARATLGGELGTLADHLEPAQLHAMALEVVEEVLANDRGFSEYVTTYVANITASSVSDADRLRKVRSYADILLGRHLEDDYTPPSDDQENRVQPVTSSHAGHITREMETGSPAHPDGVREVIVCLTCAGEVIGEAGLTLVSYVTETEYRAGDPENLGHTSYTEALGHAQSRMAVNGAGNSKTSIYRLESGRRIWVETLGGLRDITPWNTGAAMPCPTCEEWVQEGDDCAQGHYAQETKEETEEETELAVCVDCAHLLASGELPEGDPEFSLLPEWDGDVLALACGEDREPWFSWSRCDGCGSTLGGDRHPAAVISSPEEEDSNLEAFITEFPHVPEEVLRELLDGYEDATTDDIAYEGEFYSYADLANHMVEEGLFGEIPEHLSRYIDIDAIGRDLDAEGVYEIRHNFTGYYWTIH